MIFFRMPPLQQNTAAVVDDEDRERAVQQAGAVHLGLAGRAGGAVGLVDQDQLLLGRAGAHGFFACRRSFTRTALPCERGTSPGALSATSQVTPTIDLM